ncbi:site-specific integrase [uncultured Xylophilus sp.]|uniref:tyrosine-type recombinase/integrase n=1 Tax=uncultured Xylophilus sp. TaxID=296832 RepID=UPI0025F911F4|nr:site-specific integrase [uncultured Xylophilus sp.]
MTHRQLLRPVDLRSKPPGYHLDGHGLYLQVAKNCHGRSWILRYTMEGKTREMGLGSIDDFGLAEARIRANRFRQQIADGIDPVGERQKAKAARKAEKVAAEAQAQAQVQASTTFRHCAQEYHHTHKDEWKNAKHGEQWINTLATYAFPAVGDLPIGEVGKPQIVKALAPIWKDKAETASRVLQRIRTVMNYGAAKDYCLGLDAEVWKQVKLALGTNDRARKVEHHASCPYKDVPALLHAVRQSTATTQVKLAFEFTILTAARSGEVRGARWAEVDAQMQHWTIPGDRMKASREHRVPLSARAKEILRQAKQQQEYAGFRDPELIFCNPKGQAYSDMTFTQLLRRLGFNYTMHGFRSSFRVWGMEATDYPHELLEMALAHVVGDQTVRAYARGDMAQRRLQLMEDWSKAAQTSNDK